MTVLVQWLSRFIYHGQKCCRVSLNAHLKGNFSDIFIIYERSGCLIFLCTFCHVYNNKQCKETLLISVVTLQYRHTLETGVLACTKHLDTMSQLKLIFNVLVPQNSFINLKDCFMKVSLVVETFTEARNLNTVPRVNKIKHVPFMSAPMLLPLYRCHKRQAQWPVEMISLRAQKCKWASID